ncbi:MAG: hypothetical protein M3Y71_10965 [Actinomycetota bacterium]|nr:hypothetical protein [Actinomycetota bacterium]
MTTTIRRHRAHGFGERDRAAGPRPWAVQDLVHRRLSAVGDEMVSW